MEARHMMNTRILRPVVAAIVLIAVVGGCDWMEPKFRRNGKLTLLLSGRAADTSLWSPVVTPSGTELYYLSTDGTIWHRGHASGQLWKAKIDGSEGHVVVDGGINAFALSADGTRLALATESRNLLLADDAGTVEDTLTTVSGGTLWGVLFSRQNPERIYYRVDNLAFAINLDGSGQHEVTPDSIDGFPSVQPSGSYALVTLAQDQFRHDLGLAAQTADTTPLHASPYKYSEVYPEFSCWTPTESAIVFTSFEWRVSDPMRPEPSEIWKFEPVFGR